MLKDLYLCRHRGIFAKIVRLITGSDWDHVVLRDRETGIWHDMNYPYGYTEWIKEVPWEIESFTLLSKEVSKFQLVPYKHLSTRYNLWFNLNWLTWKLFRWAPIDPARNAGNCVSFICDMWRLKPEWAYLSPEELVKKIGEKR